MTKIQVQDVLKRRAAEQSRILLHREEATEFNEGYHERRKRDANQTHYHKCGLNGNPVEHDQDRRCAWVKSRRIQLVHRM